MKVDLISLDGLNLVKMVNIKKLSGLVSLQTVLESRDHVHGPVGDDDFELWDQSQMLRAHQQLSSGFANADLK